MTVFLIVAALFVLAAVLFIVPPLLKKEGARAPVADRRSLNISIYRDQMKELERDLANDVISAEQYQRGREELELRLLEDVPAAEAAPAPVRTGRPLTTVVAAAVIAVFVPLTAAGLYAWLGTPAALDPKQAEPVATGGAPGHDQISAMVAALEQRLSENPNDAAGWTMLGRSYLYMQQIDRAMPALEKALALDGGDPNLLVDYADALAMTGGGSLEGRPMEMIERALAIDPDNQKGLWLAGTAAYERADYPDALRYWQRLYDVAQPGSETAMAMENAIAEVKALMEGRDPSAIEQHADAGAPAAAGQAANAVRVSGTIDVDAALRSRIEPGSTLFVFARAAAGPRMPLAVLRVPAGKLPMDFELDDSMAMDPSMSLSKFPEVVVTARISSSGGAMTQSGDLQGSSGVIRPAATSGPLRIVIDEVVP